MKGRMMFIYHIVTLSIEARQFRLVRQSEHIQSFSNTHSLLIYAAFEVSNIVDLFTQVSRLHTHKEGAWSDIPPTLAPSQPHQDSNPVLSSVYHLQ